MASTATSTATGSYDWALMELSAGGRPMLISRHGSADQATEELERALATSPDQARDWIITRITKPVRKAPDPWVLRTGQTVGSWNAQRQLTRQYPQPFSYWQ